MGQLRPRRYSARRGCARGTSLESLRLRRAALGGLWLCLSLGAASARADESLTQLQSLSLEQLSDVDVTSVSKAPEPIKHAAAAIYVITHEEIMRSGATSIPEMLRLAPNLEVFETSPSRYIITARGFSGNEAAQNFTNKILVLIDGRSVYNPLFSGMYWDMQDIPPEDIERIEVISGPGGTLYGANAVNGVVNIITRNSAATKGGSVDIGYGNIESGASAQYGGQLTDTLTYRVYAKIFRDESFRSSGGTSADDGWYKPQGGFRLDWNGGGADDVTLSGDIFKGAEDQLSLPNQLIDGGNITARWQHQLSDGSSFQVLAYYDEEERLAADGNGGFSLRTFDIEFQHNFTLLGGNQIVWGLGERASPYDIKPDVGSFSSLYFIPARRTLNLADAFVQDRIDLSDTLELTLGLKLEDDPFSHFAPLPSGRIAWSPMSDLTLWAAVSRAIRSPTPFDVDVNENLGTTHYLTGDKNFMPETLIAYEAGARAELSTAVTLSVSGYYNDYGDLRSIEFGTTTPLTWGNLMKGHVEGIEAWGTYQATSWWQLNAGVNWITEQLGFAPGASEILGVAQQGDDPSWQAHVMSSMNLGSGVTFDADLRYVDELPNPRVPDYVELNGRVGWAITDGIEVALSGFNLLHAHHLEFSPDDQIPRSFYFDVKWKV